MAYPAFFLVLHDEPNPIGDLGRGTHHSVFRIPTWFDEGLASLSEARFQDFAVIWDEDHDARVLDVAFSLYLKGLLAPVLFIGERKGTLTILLNPKTSKYWSKAELQEYSMRVEALSSPSEDSWTAVVDHSEGSDHSIINDRREKVSLYLANIQMLWSLGLKDSG